MAQSQCKVVRRVLKKLKVELPHDSAVPLLGLYLKKSKTLIQKETSTPMFAAALFTTARYGSNGSAHQATGG